MNVLQLALCRNQSFCWMNLTLIFSLNDCFTAESSIMIVEYGCKVIVLSIRRKSHLSVHLGKVNNPWYSKKQTRKTVFSCVLFVSNQFEPVWCCHYQILFYLFKIFFLVYFEDFWKFLKIFSIQKFQDFFSKWVFSIRNGSSRIYLSRDCTSLWAVHLPV